MTELDHLPRYKIGDVDPDVPLPPIRRFRNRRGYPRNELVLTLGGAARADLTVHEDLMPLQRTAADAIAIRRDVGENDLGKAGPSAGSLAAAARDLGRHLP